MKLNSLIKQAKVNGVAMEGNTEVTCYVADNKFHVVIFEGDNIIKKYTEKVQEEKEMKKETYFLFEIASIWEAKAEAEELIKIKSESLVGELQRLEVSSVRENEILTSSGFLVGESGERMKYYITIHKEDYGTYKAEIHYTKEQPVSGIFRRFRKKKNK